MSHLGCLNIFCLFDILICSFQGTALRVFHSATYSDCLTSHQVVGSFSCYLIAGQAAVRVFYYDTYLYKHTFSSACYFFVIWQPPAFPYRLQYSIIGRLRLNLRVRDVYGCFP